MPELPEVETVRRQLAAEVAGTRWAALTAHPSSLFRTPAARLAARLHGARLAGVARRGKVLVLSFEGGDVLLAHLGMSGQILLAPPAQPGPGHRHLEVTLEDGRTLVFRDPRRFGYLRLAAGGELDRLPELAGIGTDPLDPAVTWERFSEALVTRAGAVKPLLMDQRLFAGLGNVYADEILHAARVRPARPAADLSVVERKELFHAVRAVLGAAIQHGGTSFDEAFTDLYGRPGLYGGCLRVYGRAGEPCPRCFASVRVITLGGRSTHFCPSCQR